MKSRLLFMLLIISIIFFGCDLLTQLLAGESFLIKTSVDGNGTVSINPDQETYAPGTDVELIAVPEPGWSFGHWLGDESGSANPLTVNLDSSITIIAVFTQDEYALTINTVGGGAVKGSGGKSSLSDSAAVCCSGGASLRRAWYMAVASASAGVISGVVWVQSAGVV